MPSSILDSVFPLTLMEIGLLDTLIRSLVWRRAAFVLKIVVSSLLIPEEIYPMFNEIL